MILIMPKKIREARRIVTQYMEKWNEKKNSVIHRVALSEPKANAMYFRDDVEEKVQAQG